MKKIYFFLIIFSNASMAMQTDLIETYHKKLHKMVENGALTESDVTSKLLQLKKSSIEDQKKFQKQVRGVASSMIKRKIYEFNNDPIEIKSK